MKYLGPLVALAFSLPVQAAPSDVVQLITQEQGHLLDFYRDLHENPELSGAETRTAEKVAGEFRALGLEVVGGIGGHGVVGILRNGSGPTTLIRSELDALPVTEATGAAFKSKTNGKMHACGHDFHATALVGTAYVMVHSLNKWQGTLIFLAQPAEELGNGALAMIKDGLFKKIPHPDQLLSLHTIGEFKKGVIGITSGAATANVDSINVVFKGKGTHGSTPQKGVDPFILTAQFVLDMQALVGREKPAIKPAVISVGSIHGGTKHNIIPDEVKLELTVRTYDAEVRALIKRRIREIAFGLAKTMNAPDPLVEIPEETPLMFNDPKLAARLKALFIANFGSEKVESPDPIMGGEDFGEFGTAAKSPSVMFWIGERNEKDPNINNHSPKYIPDFKATAPLAINAMTTALLDLHQKAAVSIK